MLPFDFGVCGVANMNRTLGNTKKQGRQLLFHLSISFKRATNMETAASDEYSPFL